MDLPDRTKRLLKPVSVTLKQHVMAGLVPAIHLLTAQIRRGCPRARGRLRPSSTGFGAGMTVRAFDTPNTGQEIKTKPGGNQAIATGTFLLRRRPRYPKSPKPLANSAKAPGK